MPHVIIAGREMRVGDRVRTIENLETCWPRLEGFLCDDKRPVVSITFDGVVGVIMRRSRVAPLNDTEHFKGEEVLAQYMTAWEAEDRKEEAEKKAQEEANRRLMEEGHRQRAQQEDAARIAAANAEKFDKEKRAAMGEGVDLNASTHSDPKPQV